MAMLPPTEGLFPSLEAILEHVNQHARTQGYAVIKRRTKKVKGKLVKAFFACDRSFKYNVRNSNPMAKPRLTRTRSTECPFLLRATLKDGQWCLFIHHDSHNHEPSYSPIAHPIHRHLPAVATAQVESLSLSGSKPREILSFLRHQGFETKAKDIYNLRQQIRSTKLGARSPIEAMVEHLQQSRYTLSYLQNSSEQLTHVFFAHPELLILLQKHPYVLLLDCTYKTNHFKMPLLNIVGVTSMHTTFYICFCFLIQETETDYTWAMQQLRDILVTDGFHLPFVIVTDRELALMNSIRKVFPTVYNLLCTWHVEQCVKGKAAKAFREDNEQGTKAEFIKTWSDLVRSRSVAVYTQEWARLQDVYRSKSELIKYLNDTWLDPFRYQLIHYWTNKVYHFGHHVTSRVEGAHNTLKGYLQVSTGDLKTVLDNVEQLLTSQHTELEAALADAKLRPGHNIQIPLFADVISRATPYALRKIL
jgi:hypothetical protein